MELKRASVYSGAIFISEHEGEESRSALAIGNLQSSWKAEFLKWLVKWEIR